MTNLNAKDLGKRLAEARKKCGKSQEQVAWHTGVKRNTISNYESGYTIPNCDFLYKFAKFCGVSADYLLYGSDYKATEIHFLSKYKQLSEEQKKLIFDVLKNFTQ